MKILVTGSSGYIGSALVKFLREKGNEVLTFDNKSSIIHNLNDKIGLEYSFERNRNIDCIIHLAALAGVEKNLGEYGSYLKNNVIGTYNLLEQMRKSNIKYIIYASSCSVYGNNNNCKESDELFPESFYGVSKIMGEELVKFYGRKHGISYQILRIFNVIGRGVNSEFQKNRLIPKILEKVKNNEPIDVFLQKDGENSQIRDYVDIKCVISAIDKLLQEPFENEIFNIASGKGNSVVDIAGICSGLANKSIKFNHVLGRDGDCNFQQGDINKSLDYNLYQNTPIKDTIKDIIENNE